MWGTGQLFDKAHNQNLLTEAFTGGFKACYPRMPRKESHALISEVVHTVLALGDRRLRGDISKPEQGVRRLAFYDCNYWSTTVAGKKWLADSPDFFVQFSSSLKELPPKVSKIFTTAKDCQHTCAHHTLRKAMETFWDTGMIADKGKRVGWAQDAITGSLKACYPTLPRDNVHDIVGEIMKNMTLIDELPAPMPPTQLYEVEGATDERAHTMNTVRDHAAMIVISVGVVGLLASVAIKRFQSRQFSRLAETPEEVELSSE